MPLRLALRDEGRQAFAEVRLRGALREGLGLALELRLEARPERAVQERLGPRVDRGRPRGEAGRQLRGFFFELFFCYHAIDEPEALGDRRVEALAEKRDL